MQYATQLVTRVTNDILVKKETHLQLFYCSNFCERFDLGTKNPKIKLVVYFFAIPLNVNDSNLSPPPKQTKIQASILFSSTINGVQLYGGKFQEQKGILFFAVHFQLI